MTTQVWLLVAGWTTFPAAVARRGAGWAPIRFPALVAVIAHSAGVTLFDTGYAPRVSAALAHGLDRLYGALLPVHVSKHDTAVAQLHALGFSRRDVSHIVISHLHADHVGGLADFPAAKVVVHPAALAQARTTHGLRRVRRGLITQLLPADLSSRLTDPRTLPPAPRADVAPFQARRLCGDDGLVIVPLPGHSRGHLGLLVRTAGRHLFLIGDATWSARTVTGPAMPHALARLATPEWARYQATIADLRRLARRRPDLLIVPSHDQDAIDQARVVLTHTPGVGQ